MAAALIALRRLLGLGAHGAEVQELLDVARAYVSVNLHTHGDWSDEAQSSARAAMRTIAFAEQRASVDTAVTRQVARLLGALHDVEAARVASAAARGVVAPKRPRSAAEAAARGFHADPDAIAALTEAAGFAPVVAPSRIAGAGLGLFVHGAVREGTVIALYPGDVLLPEVGCCVRRRSSLTFRPRQLLRAGRIPRMTTCACARARASAPRRREVGARASRCRPGLASLCALRPRCR